VQRLDQFLARDVAAQELNAQFEGLIFGLEI
jgi:hypothetical protein